MFRLRSVLLALILCAGGSTSALAGPCVQEWSTDFPGADFDAVVTSIVEWNGDWYAGGDFRRAGGSPAAGLARWDGSGWSEVGGGLTAQFPFFLVQDMLVFDDGSGEALYVCGRFVEAGGQPITSIARWDGTSWSDVGGGTTQSVNALEVYDDGSGPCLYAGGVFDLIGGVTAYDVAKWDGVSWTPVGAGISTNTTGVYDMSVWNGALVVGGDFQDIDGTPASCLAAWDGTTWSEVGGGVSNHIYTMESYDLGQGDVLYIGGILSTAGGVQISGVGAWDGSTWDDMGGGIVGDFLGVRAFGLYDDGGGAAVYAGGGFESAGGVPADNFAKWDGTSWSDPGSELNSTVDAMYTDGSLLLLGGNFTKSDLIVCTKFAGWDGATAQSFSNGDVGNGLSSPAHAFPVVDFDGSGGDAPRQFVAGYFFNAGDTFVDLVAELDGTTWIPLAEEGPDLPVDHAIAFDDGGGEDLYIAGRFTDVNGVSVNHIANWNGSAWTDLAGGLSNSGFPPSPGALETYNDGTGNRLYVAGSRFDTAGGTSVQNIAAWDGATWSDVGGGFPEGFVADLEVYDSALIAAGGFETAGAVPALNIASWDGTNWSSLGSGLNGSVSDVANFVDQNGEQLYAAGFFTASGGTPLGPIARWDGSTWVDASSGFDGSVFGGFQVYDDGSGPALFVGTRRTRANGTSFCTLQVWDGIGWNDVAIEIEGFIRGLGVGPDPADPGGSDALYVGGDFLVVNGFSASRITRLGCEDVSSIRHPETESASPSWFLAVGPNPSRGLIEFGLDFDEDEFVEISIFNASGARVGYERFQAGAGRQVFSWSGRSDGSALPAGAYFYRVRAGSDFHGGRITVVR